MTLLEAAAASKDLVAILKDVMLAGAGVATAIIAFRGLSTWNRQLRGGADFDVARKLAKTLYALREALATARSRLLRIHELDPAERENSTGTTRGSDYARAYGDRWRLISAALEEFDAAVLEAEALWGEQVRAAADLMHACLRELSSSMEAITDNEKNGGESFRFDPEFGIQMRRNVHASRDGGDPLSLAIGNAIGTMEAILRPHLRRT